MPRSSPRPRRPEAAQWQKAGEKVRKPRRPAVLVWFFETVHTWNHPFRNATDKILPASLSSAKARKSRLAKCGSSPMETAGLFAPSGKKEFPQTKVCGNSQIFNERQAILFQIPGPLLPGSHLKSVPPIKNFKNVVKGVLSGVLVLFVVLPAQGHRLRGGGRGDGRFRHRCNFVDRGGSGRL